MTDKLCIFVCNSLVAEVSHIIQTGNYPDVKLMTYNSSCGRRPDKDKILPDLTSDELNQYSRVLFFGGLCQKRFKEEIPQNRKIEFINFEQCFELILNKESIYHFIKQGDYLVSNGWLRNYKQHIVDWGFDEKSSKIFFNESLKKILFLDTGISGDFKPNLIALSEYMGLPYEVFPVGLSHCINFLDAQVSKWRVDVERNSINEKLSAITKESADYLIIFKHLQNLVDIIEESLIVKEVLWLLNLLFAPYQIGFQNYFNGAEGNIIWLNSYNIDTKINQNDFFSIEITHQNETLGVFKIYGVKFPEYIEQYKRIWPVISKICGLSIANARKYKITQDQKEQLQHKSQVLIELMLSKDKLLSIIAHDLKGPFNVLLGYSELLVENHRIYNVDKTQHIIESLHSTTVQTLKLLENLLDWARSQQNGITFNPIKTDLILVVNTIVELLNPIARAKNISLIMDIKTPCFVLADIYMINAVLRNLISNAIKFTQKGGSIKIETKDQDSMVHVSVSDNGIGIKPDDIAKLFRIDTNINQLGTSGEKGTGLGLLLCKEFVEKHGGKIWVESEVGNGSKFIFSLNKTRDFQEEQ
ncbi:MAG: DUF1638 domain-containing protein [Bacteroidales bacterium]|nr:MAG: DUF1638 domain-containing protein [Bacteroidales bacterium]